MAPTEKGIFLIVTAGLNVPGEHILQNACLARNEIVNQDKRVRIHLIPFDYLKLKINSKNKPLS